MGDTNKPTFQFLRYQDIYLFGRVVKKPQAFTRKYPISPTPGGRWKVRKLAFPKGYRAYSEGPSRRFNRSFPSWELAINYAQAQATIARSYGGKFGRIRRESIMRSLFFDDATTPFTKEYVLDLIEEEKHDYYMSAQEH